MCGLECERYEEHSYANTWVSAVSSRETARGQRCETLKTAIKLPSDFQRKCYSLRKIACWKSAEAECSERFSPGVVFAKRTGQKRRRQRQGEWLEQMEVWEGTVKAESFDKENLQLPWQLWLRWLQNCIWNEETVKLYKATLCWQRIYWVAVGIVIKFSLLQFCNYKLFSKSVGR